MAIGVDWEIGPHHQGNVPTISPSSIDHIGTSYLALIRQNSTNLALLHLEAEHRGVKKKVNTFRRSQAVKGARQLQGGEVAILWGEGST